MNSRVPSLALLALVALRAPAPARAQEANPPEAPAREAELKAFINPDAKDTQTKLDLLIHTLYEVNQRLVGLEFRQQFGDRVRMEKVMIPNREADLIPGFIFTPVKMEQGRRHPAIVAVHGGFHYSLDDEFFGYVDRFVREGYVVIFPEYRGSRGYGKEHYDAQEYGGADVDDVLSAADLIASKPYVDPQKLGIVGRSRGGMVTLLAIERAPKRFQAAVDVVGLADFLMYMSYKPEYRRQEVAKEPHLKGMPFDVLEKYIEISPINHVAKIETPLLVHATTHDTTVPHQLHSARLVELLKSYGKTYEYKLYERAPGSHAYATGDTPEARDSLDRVVAFLGRYLK
jgi:dipeptidyl aminopeptidase/acylaminoacyl peptidase